MNVIKQKITIPIVNKEYTIRPYLVGEEKGLLIALETKNDETIQRAVKNLIQSCIEEKVNIDELSYFEIEYLFIQLRKMSVNNVVDIGLKHLHNPECKHVQRIQFNLDDFKTEGKIETKILLDEEEGIGVVMRLPTAKLMSKKYENNTSKIFGLIEGCIESIFDRENIYPTKDVSPEELTNWVNQLSNTHIKKIAEFFNNLPMLCYNVNYKCDACGKEESAKIKGLSNFLSYALAMRV